MLVMFISSLFHSQKLTETRLVAGILLTYINMDVLRSKQVYKQSNLSSNVCISKLYWELAFCKSNACENAWPNTPDLAVSMYNISSKYV